MKLLKHPILYRLYSRDRLLNLLYSKQIETTKFELDVIGPLLTELSRRHMLLTEANDLLTHACSTCSAKTYRALETLGLKVDVRHTTVWRETSSNRHRIRNPVHATIDHHNTEVFKILVSEHDLSGRDPSDGRASAHGVAANFSWVFYWLRRPGFGSQFANELVENGYTPESNDAEIDSSLMYNTVLDGDIKYIRFLSQNGFDYSTRFMEQEFGAFECFSFDGQSGPQIIELIDLLYELGASPMHIKRQAHGQDSEISFYGTYCHWFYIAQTFLDESEFEEFHDLFETFKTIYKKLSSMDIDPMTQVTVRDFQDVTVSAETLFRDAKIVISTQLPK